jgi:hypothetical protein
LPDLIELDAGAMFVFMERKFDLYQRYIEGLPAAAAALHRLSSPAASDANKALSMPAFVLSLSLCWLLLLFVTLFYVVVVTFCNIRCDVC